MSVSIKVSVRAYDVFRHQVADTVDRQEGFGVVVPGHGTDTMVMTAYNLVVDVNPNTDRIAVNGQSARILCVCPRFDLCLLSVSLGDPVPPAPLPKPGMVRYDDLQVQDGSLDGKPVMSPLRLKQYKDGFIETEALTVPLGTPVWSTGKTRQVVGLMGIYGMVPVSRWRFLVRLWQSDPTPGRVVHTPELGMSTESLPDLKAVAVTSVLPGGPAERAGIEPGMVLTHANGTGVTALTSPCEPMAISISDLSLYYDRVSLRTDENRTMVVTPDSSVYRGARRYIATGLETYPHVKYHGITLSPLRSNLARYPTDTLAALFLTLDSSRVTQERLVVTHIEEGSQEENVGIEVGYELLSINRSPIRTVCDVRKALGTPGRKRLLFGSVPRRIVYVVDPS
jgi:hypothetical protein